jgi:hypothetical protein
MSLKKIKATNARRDGKLTDPVFLSIYPFTYADRPGNDDGKSSLLKEITGSDSGQMAHAID